MAGNFPTYLEAYDDRPRRSRGRRLLITALVLLLLLVGLLVVADRIATRYAERAIADRVQQEIANQQFRSASPKVSVGGFPFLTQVAAGRYESISIALRDVRATVGPYGVALPKVDIDARNIEASIDTLRSGQGDMIAETVDGTGTISYASVVALMNRPGLRLAEQDGNLVVNAPVIFLGQQFIVEGTAELTAQDNTVRIRFHNLAADALPVDPAAQALINTFAQQISITIDLPVLPFRLDLQEVQARPEGLAITATAKDVPINAG